MNDIILVTGFHRTKSWMNVAFLENQDEDAQMSFATKVVDTNITFHVSPKDVRGPVIKTGPQGGVRLLHLQTQPDQIFVMTDIR
jgi:hypothetical protein